MKKSLVFITAALAIALTATHAFSWGGGKGRGGQGLTDLSINQAAWNDLSKEQRDEITTLRQKFIDDTIETRMAIMLKHNQVHMLMETSNPEKAKLMELTREVSDLMTRVQEKRIDFLLAAKKVAPELKFGPGTGRCAFQKALSGGGKGGRIAGNYRNQAGNCGRY